MKGIVLENIEKYKLIDKKDNVLIGLSGGPDSVFLFHILKDLRKELDFNLHIAHVNHGIRGKEALKDQIFVEDLAKQYNLPFYLKLADMDGYAREHNLSSEEAGREIRYDFFNEILDRLGGGKIAVGHNKSDQVETMLMRFFRGTGIDGLRGIEYKNNNIIRPMLNIRREDLENYLKENGLESRIDKTNLETIYNRNKIRLETIPHIEKNYNPNLIDTVFRSSDNFKEDSDFLESYTDEIYKKITKRSKDMVLIDKESFLKEHRSIRSRILRKIIENIKGDLQGITQQHIVNSLDFIEMGNTGKMIDLLEDIKVFISYDRIKVGKNIEIYKEDFCFDLVGEKTKIDELKIEVELEVMDIDKFKTFGQNPYIKYFDYDKIKSNLQIRNRRNGDVFQPFGMDGRSKKVKDFFIDEKVPRDERDKVLFLTENDNILWLVGYRINDNYKITESTEKVLVVKILRRISNG